MRWITRCRSRKAVCTTLQIFSTSRCLRTGGREPSCFKAEVRPTLDCGFRPNNTPPPSSNHYIRRQRMPDDAQQHLNPAAAVDLVDGRHQASIGATVDVNAHGITPLPCRAAVSCSHCWCSCICLRKTASTAACSSVTKWLRSFRMKSRTPRVASTASTSRSVPQEAVSGKHRLCEDPSDLVAVAADAAGLHPPADHRDEHLEPELGIRNRPQRLSAARYSSRIIGAISAAPTPCAAEASPQRPFRISFVLVTGWPSLLRMRGPPGVLVDRANAALVRLISSPPSSSATEANCCSMKRPVWAFVETHVCRSSRNCIVPCIIEEQFVVVSR